MYATMHAHLMALANTTFQTSYIQPGIECLTPQQAKTFYRNFRGPPCFNSSHFPVVPPPPTPPFQPFQLGSPDGVWCLSGQKGLGERNGPPRFSGSSTPPNCRQAPPN
jgi:hypothetical protein